MRRDETVKMNGLEPTKRGEINTNKKTVDENFKKIDSYFDPTDKV